MGLFVCDAWAYVVGKVIRNENSTHEWHQDEVKHLCVCFFCRSDETSKNCITWIERLAIFIFTCFFFLFLLLFYSFLLLLLLFLLLYLYVVSTCQWTVVYPIYKWLWSSTATWIGNNTFLWKSRARTFTPFTQTQLPCDRKKEKKQNCEKKKNVMKDEAHWRDWENNITTTM